MQFRQGLQYARTQLELHPERYQFMNASIPEGRTKSACIFGFVAEAAGLAGRRADVHGMADHMNSAHETLDFADAFYTAMTEALHGLPGAKDDDGMLLIPDWRDSPTTAIACLDVYLASSNPDLDEEIPAPELFDEDDDEDDDFDDEDDDLYEEDENTTDSAPADKA